MAVVIAGSGGIRSVWLRLARGGLCCMGLFWVNAIGAQLQPPAFSELPGDEQFRPSGAELPSGWTHQTLRHVEPNRFSIEAVNGAQVLRIQVSRSASAVTYSPPASSPSGLPLNTPEWLCWRWRASAFPAGAELGRKAGDDFAGRIYLMFDYPLERVPALQRLALRAGRLLYDENLPAATVVYLLHEGPDSGQFVESPYSSRVRMRVASPNARPGEWRQACRSVSDDFQAAFGREYGPGLPPIKAIAVGADGDQTLSRFTTEVGDLRWSREPPTGSSGRQ